MAPCGKDSQRIVAKKLSHRNAPCGRRDFQFVIDEGVVEARGCGVGGICGIKNSRGALPVNGSQTHGEGITGGIEVGASELKIVQNTAGLANRPNLSLSLWI